MHSHNQIRPMGLSGEAQPYSSGLGLPPHYQTSSRIPTLTFSQGFLEKVVLGLELGDEVPAFQVLLHFL